MRSPGVVAVVTAADLPEVASKTEQIGEGAVNTRYLAMNILAGDKVLYDGHPVAAVAASGRHTAEEALRLIEVEYDLPPPVMTVEDAMKPDAPILLPDLRNKEDGPENQTNIANHIQFNRGNLDEGFNGNFRGGHRTPIAMAECVRRARRRFDSPRLPRPDRDCE